MFEIKYGGDLARVVFSGGKWIVWLGTAMNGATMLFGAKDTQALAIEAAILGLYALNRIITRGDHKPLGE